MTSPDKPISSATPASGPFAEPLARAFEAHRAGRLDEAEAAYRGVLAREPNQPEALHHLGLVLHQRGKNEEALALIQRAIALAPGEVQPRFNLATVLETLGRSAEADAAYTEAARLTGEAPDGLLAQAAELERAGRLVEAAHHLRMAHTLAPEQPEPAEALAALSERRKRWSEALRWRAWQTARDPANAAAWCRQGIALGRLQRYEEAMSPLSKASALDPALALAHRALGDAHQALGRHRQAVLHYERALALQAEDPDVRFAAANSLAACGAYPAAIAQYREVIRLRPADARAHNNLANALFQTSKLDDAEASSKRALEIAPGLPEALGNLGNIAYKRYRLRDAEHWFREALEVKPGWGEALNNLGNTYLRSCQVEEALKVFRRALAAAPDNLQFASNCLFALNYRDPPSLRWMYEEHRRFGERLEASVSVPARYANDRSPDRPLRIGFVAACLRLNPITEFMEALFQHHDRAHMHFTMYSGETLPDVTTKRIKPMLDAWRDVMGLPDAQVAALVQADQIDLLVDLIGHMADNRLGVFARKPAPVQVGYMGYLNTTGLNRIDYWITDTLQNPPETQAYFSEKLWFLPRCFVCFTPEPDAGEPAPPPMLTRGHPSFGCYNNLSKLSPRCIQVWSALLKAVPTARLVFKGVQAGDESVRERVAAWFVEHGIEAGRLEFLGATPHREYMASFAEADVALDPFPYNGNTSTHDALWMGVPVVSLAGDNAISRSGVSLLTDLGRPEWVARGEEEYVRIASELVADPARLVTIRAGLRAEMVRSRLSDGPGFTRAMEAAFRGMWREWCRKG